MIETGECIASISGQSMAAAMAWDGTITLEENIAPFSVQTGLITETIADDVFFQTMEEMKTDMADSIGMAAIGAFGRPVDMRWED